MPLSNVCIGALPAPMAVAYHCTVMNISPRPLTGREERQRDTAFLKYYILLVRDMDFFLLSLYFQIVLIFIYLYIIWCALARTTSTVLDTWITLLPAAFNMQRYLTGFLMISVLIGPPLDI